MIERLAIENLGPIESTEITLSPLTVLLGGNASGKTTVLRAFELLSSLCQDTLDTVSFGSFALAGEGWTSVIHRGDETRVLGLKAWSTGTTGSPAPAPERAADYEVGVAIDWDRALEAVGTPGGEPVFPEILSDRLIDPATGNWIEGKIPAYSIRELQIRAGAPRTASIPATLRGVVRHPSLAAPLSDLIEFVQSFGTARYFKPVGGAMVAITGDARVWPAGEGFVDALASWQNANVEAFVALVVRLRAIFPHIRMVRIERDGLTRKLAFETTRSSKLTPAELEADGVLTTLFLLWAAATTPPHGTLLLDDPEAGLHPHLIGERVTFLRELAQGSHTGYPIRVICATQSVEFAQHLDLSEVRIVEHDPEHGTKVRSVPRDAKLTTLLETYRSKVGELWYSGVLGGLPGTGA